MSDPYTTPRKGISGGSAAHKFKHKHKHKHKHKGKAQRTRQTTPNALAHMQELLALPDEMRARLAQFETHKFSRGRPAPPIPGSAARAAASRLCTVELDSFEAGLALLRGGFQPCVLNMANEINCGGAWCNGNGSQEEHLFRVSSLPLSLWPHRRPDDDRLPECEAALPRDDATYPWRAEATVEYTPVVLITRDADEEALEEAERRELAVVSAAAQDLRHGGTFDAALTREKARAILWVARHHGHDGLVLGAFGCGAFRNDPRQIAGIFRSLLAPGAEFGGVFRFVVFAIIKSVPLLTVFSEVFPLVPADLCRSAGLAAAFDTMHGARAEGTQGDSLLAQPAAGGGTPAAAAATAAAPPAAPDTVPLEEALDQVRCRALLASIYGRFCPEKVATVDALLDKYRGHEEQLLAAVRKKYLPEDATRTICLKHFDHKDGANPNRVAKNAREAIAPIKAALDRHAAVLNGEIGLVPRKLTLDLVMRVPVGLNVSEGSWAHGIIREMRDVVHKRYREHDPQREVGLPDHELRRLDKERSQSKQQQQARRQSRKGKFSLHPAKAAKQKQQC